MRELPDPPVVPDVVLVRVRAAGVNPVDWKVREGYLAGAFPSHFPLVPGWDAAGVVAAVGPAVTGFAVGDEVVDAGRLTVHVARTFPLDQAADAHRLVETGHVRGKVVVEM
ncbi:zinc-binding dehydrogenase [Micromonospora sp. WMMC415]|uniref:alcohol dehydrogenase catalytic domain-containing protein n=1 Tax=Micromonospora sp. WMMC415 TaxID=2675222 RepID=UPI0012B4B093|nr:zinc-binding dehydrogenase [Micromonospora sp. WMMC415]QGN47472.1 zinc-binding dehydrogenase [Micromonospora sp. WMMC415]